MQSSTEKFFFRRVGRNVSRVPPVWQTQIAAAGGVVSATFTSTWSATILKLQRKNVKRIIIFHFIFKRFSFKLEKKK